jgi:hypothetical protein
MSCSSAGSDAPCDAAPCSVRRSSSSCSPVCESCRRRWLSQRAAETPLSPANKRLTARKRHIRRRPTMTIGCPGLILTVCSRGRPTYSRYLLTTPPPSPRLRDAGRVLVPREAGRPRRTLVWLSTDRPHQPAAVTFEDVLTGMANHQLATTGERLGGLVLKPVGPSAGVHPSLIELADQPFTCRRRFPRRSS